MADSVTSELAELSLDELGSLGAGAASPPEPESPESPPQEHNFPVHRPTTTLNLFTLQLFGLCKRFNPKD